MADPGRADSDPANSVDDGTAAPAFILDLLFTFNIALSIMVLLVAMFTQRTLSLRRSRPFCCLPPCCDWR
jgi:hypothetical protein